MSIIDTVIKRWSNEKVEEPYVVGYWPNGSIQYRNWMIAHEYGLYCHRCGGLPAQEVFWDNGNPQCFKWYENGVFIKEEYYNKDGVMTFRDLGGVKVNKLYT
jgi:hypothetical protein